MWVFGLELDQIRRFDVGLNCSSLLTYFDLEVRPMTTGPLSFFSGSRNKPNPGLNTIPTPISRRRLRGPPSPIAERRCPASPEKKTPAEEAGAGQWSKSKGRFENEPRPGSHASGPRSSQDFCDPVPILLAEDRKSGKAAASNLQNRYPLGGWISCEVSHSARCEVIWISRALLSILSRLCPGGNVSASSRNCRAARSS